MAETPQVPEVKLPEVKLPEVKKPSKEELLEKEIKAAVGDYLVVSESFDSIQGEGASVGIPSLFLRLTGCQLTCPGWGVGGCDTTEVWKTGKRRTYEEILTYWEEQGWVNGLLGNGRKRLIVTGGEPFLQEKRVIGFLRYLRSKLATNQKGARIEVEWETNCLIPPTAHNAITKEESSIGIYQYFNCCPKLKSAGNVRETINSAALSAFANLSWLEHAFGMYATFKFVIQDAEKDIAEVLDLQRTFNINPGSILLMPQGASTEELAVSYPIVAELCKQHQFKFSPRLHVNIWNLAVGV